VAKWQWLVDPAGLGNIEVLYSARPADLKRHQSHLNRVKSADFLCELENAWPPASDAIIVNRIR
jgi:hypothetical protein